MHADFLSIATRLKSFIAGNAGAPTRRADEEFGALALAVFHLQYHHNIPYRALCDSKGLTPSTVTEWTGIPFVPTSSFKSFAFTCIPESDRRTLFQSSGTTDVVRSETHHCVESLALYETSVLAWFKPHLLPELDAERQERSPVLDFISLTPPLHEAPRSSLVHMLDTVSRQAWFRGTVFVGCAGEAAGLAVLNLTHPTSASGWTLDLERLRIALETARDGSRPVLITGTAFNYVHLLDALGTASFRLPAGSRLMETGGYKGRSRSMDKEVLHTELSNRLGVPRHAIVTEYGMTELASQAYDHVAGLGLTSRTLKFPPWTRARVVSPESGIEVAEGDIGLAQVLDLANAFSVVAVETEDLAIRCADGLLLQGRQKMAEQRGCSLMTT